MIFITVAIDDMWAVESDGEEKATFAFTPPKLKKESQLC
jgi:hypothetical protein